MCQQHLTLYMNHEYLKYPFFSDFKINFVHSLSFRLCHFDNVDTRLRRDLHQILAKLIQRFGSAVNGQIPGPVCGSRDIVREGDFSEGAVSSLPENECSTNIYLKAPIRISPLEFCYSTA